MRFVIGTKDYAGLGFGVRLRDEGHDVVLACNPDPADIADETAREAYERTGDGMVDKACLSDLMNRRDSLGDAYWVWDANHSVDENETLRSENFKVFGGGRYADQMEHDRQACLDFATKYGLESPPSHAFDDFGAGIEFCQQDPDTAFVYKPDTGSNYETFLPESEEPADANRELRTHLESLRASGAGPVSFILQERKEGVETNVEVWFVGGRPVFAFMTLECKKRFVLDLGELVGCAFDYAFVIPVDCRAVRESVGKLFPAYRDMRYTGFGDANFIAAKDGVWFFEKCERFGYNAHPNLFWNLARRGFGENIASLVDGNFEPDFAEGFGSAVTMSTKPGCPGGKAVQFPEKLEKDIYWWDVYRDDGLWLTSGYDRDGNILIVNGYGYTMPTAWENVMKKAAEIRFPYRHYRPDGDQTNYPSSPIRRYEALKAMGYI